MSDFLHIYIVPKQGINRDQVEKKMNLAVDWFRYDDKCWIVFTTSDVKKWYARLMPLIRPGGNILICRIDSSSYFGWMSKTLWEWMTKNKERM